MGFLKFGHILKERHPDVFELEFPSEKLCFFRIYSQFFGPEVPTLHGVEMWRGPRMEMCH